MTIELYDDPGHDETMAAEVRTGDSDDTQSSASGADAETTIVPSDPAAVDAYAWSEGDEPEAAERHPWGAAWELAARITVCTGLLAGALIAWHVISSHHHSAQASARATTAPSVAPPAVTTVTAPPVTVTETPTAQPAPEPTTWTVVFTAAQDQWLANQLSTWYQAAHGQRLDRAFVIANAHRYCTLRSQGESTYQASQQVFDGVDQRDIDELTMTAIEAYPSCH